MTATRILSALRADYLRLGWCRFPYDEALADWAKRALPAARDAAAAPENAHFYRCGGTWFVGVNALANGPDGALPGGSPLSGLAVQFVRDELGLTALAWDRGQVSIVYPGYPRRMADESDTAFRFRRERDAAHIDGVSREGTDRRRHLQVLHEFILGVPIVDVGHGGSPLVVFEGSHKLVREAFRERLGQLKPALWPGEDVSALYRSVRRSIFAQCRRVEVLARPGEAYLLHRFTLHGIAPWTRGDFLEPSERIIVYFRPETTSPEVWFDLP